MDDRAELARIREEGDPGRRASLVAAYVTAKEPLLRKLSEKYASIEKTTAPLADIHQAGRIGMTKAILTFNPDAECEISTWAGWKIRREVQDLAHVEKPIKLPQIRGTAADRDRIMRALRENPDVTADELGIKDGMLERFKKTMNLRYVSVDMFGDGDDAPARARRIERRITELGEQTACDDDVDVRRAACTVVDAVRACAKVAGIALEDVLVGAARALGCDISPPVTMPAQPRAKKAPSTCPNPPPSPSPSSPPPRLLRRCSESAPRLVALPRRNELLRRSPLPLLRRPSSPPLRSSRPTRCNPPPPCSTPTPLFLPSFGLSCEPKSPALRKAA